MSAGDTRDNLSADQLRAIGTLLGGGTGEEAADASGVTLRTLRRWQDQRGFQDELREQARQSFRRARNQLLAAQEEAVETLWKNLRTGTTADQVRAARALLDLGLKVAEDDYEERLKRLERLEATWPVGTTRRDSQHLKSA
jgi:hypothetical protein